jgi:hypothetical protein
MSSLQSVKKPRKLSNKNKSNHGKKSSPLGEDSTKKDLSSEPLASEDDGLLEQEQNPSGGSEPEKPVNNSLPEAGLDSLVPKKGTAAYLAARAAMGNLSRAPLNLDTAKQRLTLVQTSLTEELEQISEATRNAETKYNECAAALDAASAASDADSRSHELATAVAM